VNLSQSSDWNMLPIGQALWLKELETYQKYPPMQDPASYNLDQVMNQLKKPVSHRVRALVARGPAPCYLICPRISPPGQRVVCTFA